MTQEHHRSDQQQTGSIIEQLDKNILTLSMCNPAKKNALNYAMYSDLSQTLEQAASNAEVHVVILTGTDQAFTSGNDVHAFKARPSTTTAPFFHPVLKATGHFSQTDYCQGEWCCNWDW